MTTNSVVPAPGRPLDPADPPDPQEPELPRVPPALLRWGLPVVVLVLVGLAILVLHSELRHYRYHDISRSLAALPARAFLVALGLTVLGYLTLANYDLLALRYVGRPVPSWRVALTSFIAYAFVQTLGFSMVTGGAIRFRFWSLWGLTPAEILQGISFSAITFWLGVVTVAGLVFVFAPGANAFAAWGSGVPIRLIGVVLLLLSASYLLWCGFFRRPFTIRGVELRAPRLTVALQQLVVSGLDWVLAGAVLWSLLRHFAPIPFAPFLGLFLAAQVAGLVSHVPGGLGIFDALIVIGLRDHLPAPQVLSALLAYRGIYYLLPFAVAALLMAGHEMLHRRQALAAATRFAGRWVPWLVPVLLPAGVFLAGAVLLFSGATPSVHGRLATLAAYFPLGLIEISHFSASLTGAALLVLAWGLQRRLDGAWVLASGALVAGIVLSLLKGLDWEEALILSIVLLALLPARRHFYRKAALLAEPLSPGWLIATALVMATATWLGFFAYQHVEFRGELWWQFALHGDAPRFLRATVGAVGMLMLGGIRKLLQPAPPEPVLPSRPELEQARVIAQGATDTAGNLALLGDKALLFSDSKRAFLMYGVEKRSWVALGDPIGPAEEHAELAWRFRETADRHGGWTVFYEVGTRNFPLYVDLGLSLVKVGEQARVRLTGFNLEGSGRKPLRRAQRVMEKEGVRFELVAADQVPALLPEFRQVSDAWLSLKHVREKGFSLGRFDPDYLSCFPAGVVRRGDRILGFANVWLGGDRYELSVDLMRHLPDTPPGLMEFLFTELMLWGAAQGYQWFNLGMAPLAGLGSHALAPLWSRAGALLFRHGEHFYNFQGLREYKDKFDPVWEPRYLASPGGLALPRVLTHIATLVSGGLGGLVRK